MAGEGLSAAVLHRHARIRSYPIGRSRATPLVVNTSALNLLKVERSASRAAGTPRGPRGLAARRAGSPKLGIDTNAINPCTGLEAERKAPTMARVSLRFPDRRHGIVTMTRATRSAMHRLRAPRVRARQIKVRGFVCLGVSKEPLNI